MRHYNESPRYMTAKYPGTCAETGKPIAKGARCLYYPRDRKIYAEDSNQAREWNSCEFDRVYLATEY
jgi:hypothetical protein